MLGVLPLLFGNAFQTLYAPFREHQYHRDGVQDTDQ